MGLLAAVKALLPIAQHLSTGQADLQIALLRETLSNDTPADGAAGTDYDNYLWTAPRAGKVKSVTILPYGAGLTAHDSDYSTVSICKGAAAAATVTVLASILTKITGGTGDWTQYVPESITCTDSCTFAAGEQLLLRSAKTGNGVVVPASLVTVEVEYD